jgi:hypothetical protein
MTPPERPAVVEQPQRGPVRADRPGRAQVGVQRGRVDQHPGVEQPGRVADRLDRTEQAQ